MRREVVFAGLKSPFCMARFVLFCYPSFAVYLHFFISSYLYILDMSMLWLNSLVDKRNTFSCLSQLRQFSQVPTIYNFMEKQNISSEEIRMSKQRSSHFI